jgi:mono/diheme cytochrome c family protein
MRTLSVVLLAVLVVFAAAGGALAWYTFSGRYSVAAAEPHYGVVRDALGSVYRASVERHAGELEPPELGDERINAGALVYAEECARCHAVPGGERLAWVEGLRPVPPHLPRDGTPFGTSEIYWIVDHGVRMSGMPSWRGVLSEEEMWNVAALVARMPDLAEKDYEARLARASAARAAAGGGSAPEGAAAGAAPSGDGGTAPGDAPSP